MRVDRPTLRSAALVTFALLLAAALTACAALEEIGPTGLTELEPGDCFNFTGPASVEFDHVNQSPCAASHDAEVLGTVAFEEEEYPGSAWLNGVLANKCNRVVEAYFSDSFGGPSEGLMLSWIVPTEASWNEGFHAAVCFAAAEKGKLRGSVK
jgi:hypothetical protein